MAVRTGSSSLFPSSFYIYILINLAIHYDGLKKYNLGIEKKKRKRNKEEAKKKRKFFIFKQDILILQTQ